MSSGSRDPFAHRLQIGVTSGHARQRETPPVNPRGSWGFHGTRRREDERENREEETHGFRYKDWLGYQGRLN